MRTKNAKAITQDEHDHIERVKLLSCGVCGVGGGYGSPSEAHHIVQGQHWTVIPLCGGETGGCHRSLTNGIHGQARIWSVYKKTEMSVLNDTIKRLYGC